MSQLKHVFIDMDGVLVDWFGGVCDLLGVDRQAAEAGWPDGASTEQTLGIDAEDLWRRINRYGVNWWEHLAPLPGIADLFNLFYESSTPISILTSPANSVFAATGKMLWVRQYLPGLDGRVHLSADKSLLAKPGTLLIDDHDENCNRFRDAGGIGVVYPQPWNKKRFHSGRPIESIKAQLRFYGVTDLFPGK